jgi:4-amino-4-deoxy-L-arabinose transferase-like glycosyltransferase
MGFARRRLFEMQEDEHERLPKRLDEQLNQRQPGAAPAPSRAVSAKLILFATVAFFVARIPLIARRVFDPDELEHSHAAWSVFKGMLPYRDFFEHHTPWYYFALSPFFHWFAVDQSFESARHFLLFARVLSLVLAALSVVLVIRLGRLVANRSVGLLAGLFVAAQPIFIQKTLEIRPDVPAFVFFVGALWFLLRGLSEDEAATTPRLRWFLGGGLCLGAAIVCTQKMLFVLPGAFLGLGLWAFAGGLRAMGARILAALIVGVGVAVPALFTWTGFAVHDGGRQFIYNNFLLNTRFQLRSFRGVQATLKTSWPILVLALLGAGVALYRFSRAKQRRYGDVLLLCTLGGLLAGIVVVPVVYEQYCLVPLSIACLFAAQGLSFLVNLVQERARAWVLVCAILPLLVLPVLNLGWSFGHRNDRQMARLRYVFEHTGPADTVLDGWLGTQVFRPHPLYYFFMHRELWGAMSESDKEAYLGPLESGKVRPSLITLDDELLALGPRFMSFLHKNYASSDGLFYFPTRTPHTTADENRQRH